MSDAKTPSAGDATPASTVVVTGAAGWLGQNLVRELATDRAHVKALVRDDREASLLDVIGPNIETVVGDVRDPEAVDRLFEGVASPTVFHAAGVIHPTKGVREFFDVNVGGTELVLDRARRVGSQRFVHVSSNSPFGANPTPNDTFDEQSAYNPYMGYGASKMEAEQIVFRNHERGDVEAVIVRPPWFYGPCQPERQNQFLRAVRRGKFPLVGDGSQRRSMAYTGNLVHGLLRAEVAAAAPGHAYWIADAEPYALRDVFAKVREAFVAEGFDVTDRQPPMPRIASVIAEKVDGRLQAMGKYAQAVHVLGELKDTIACDVSGAREQIGYDPKVELVEGMRNSIRWCLDRGVEF